MTDWKPISVGCSIMIDGREHEVVATRGMFVQFADGTEAKLIYRKGETFIELDESGSDQTGVKDPQ